jgi:hypothetical protein
MSDASGGITFRDIQEMMPECHLPDDLLNGLIAALPPAVASGADHRGGLLARRRSGVRSACPPWHRAAVDRCPMA